MSRHLVPLLACLLLPAPVHATTLLLCPGAPRASAGAVTQDYTTPLGAPMRAIVTEEKGTAAPGCRVLPLNVAASGVQALHVLPHDAVPGATLLLQGEEKDKAFTITGHTLDAGRAAPAAATPGPSPAAVAAAHGGGADAVAAIRARAPRATWVWSPDAWRERGAALLDWAAGQRIGELFINVPVRDGRVADPAALAAFVRQAHGRGIAVTASDDASEALLPAARGAAVERMRAYVAYNAQAGARTRLHGVQLDAQPRELAPDALPPATRDRHYLDLAAALRQAAGTMRLDFVAPSGAGDDDALLRGLARHADALTVRNYRTDPDAIRRHAAPFLDWGVAHGKKVRIALEAGPVGAGVERSYRRAGPGAKGDLLMFDIGGQKVLVLLKVPATQAEAVGYTLADRRAIAGVASTFHADKAALMRLLPRLELAFGAWDSFGGMAVHELR